MKKYICLLMLIAFAAAILPGCQSSNIQLQSQQQTTAVPTNTLPTAPTTEPIHTTHAPAEITIPSTTKLWTTENCMLDCKLSVDYAVLRPGDTIHIVAEITNAGAHIHYNGSLESQLGSAALKFDGQPDYQIESTEQTFDLAGARNDFSYREIVKCRYTFTIPEDAPVGSYTLEISAFGMVIRIDSERTEEVAYMRRLSELSEKDYALIWGDAFYSDEYFKSDDFKVFAEDTLLYGDFGDVFVFFTEIYGATMMTYDYVNGLHFTYGSTNQLTVCAADGWFSLGEAFEKGIISAEQLRTVYDNYYLLRPWSKPAE